MKDNTLAVPGHRFLSATIFKQPKAAVAAAVNSCLDKIAPNCFSSRDAPLDLMSIYQLAPPAGGAHARAIVLFSPVSNPENTVLVSNLVDGWGSLSFLLAKKLLKFQVQILSTQDDAEYPQAFFEVWNSGVSIRTVMVMRDTDEWKFFERGEIQTFEDPAFNKRPLKKSRLTREILVQYMQKIGWDIARQNFWTSKSSSIYFSEA